MRRNDTQDFSLSFMIQLQRPNGIFRSMNINENIGRDKALKNITEFSIYWRILDFLLFAVIVVGNVLTILAVRVARTLRRVASNLFVLNLAVSDLMVGLTLTYHIAFYMDENIGDHETTCIMRFVMASMACSSSMYSLMTIAIDRYVGVVHPLRYARYMTKMNIIIAIIVGWFNAIAISTVPIYWNCFDEAVDCEFETVLPRYYTVGILCPLICIIWMSMFFLYWRIWRAAKSHTRRLRETGFDNPSLDDCKGSKAVLSILGCFSICWIPYLVIVCSRLFSLNPTGTFYKALFSLAMANSGMNPIIYAWKNAQFRKAFHNLLRLKGLNRNKFNASLNNYLERQKELTDRKTSQITVLPIEST